MADTYTARTQRPNAAPAPRRSGAARVLRWRRGDRGATIIEYALAISLIGTLAMGSVQAVTTGGEAVIDRAVNDVEGEPTAVEGSGEIVEPEPTTTTTTTTLPPVASSFTVQFANLSWWHHNAHWTPRVRFTFIDDVGDPVPGVTVVVRFGTNSTNYMCTTDSTGVCTITGPSTHKNTNSVLMQGQGLFGTDLTYGGPTSFNVIQPPE